MQDDVSRPPRTLSRSLRRHQVIEATLVTLANRGLARLTLTEVAREAGISHGLVLFHFESKENLLAETLAFLAGEYARNWQDALNSAGPDPADRLLALIEADFLQEIITPTRLAAWCAFWGESQSRPAYQRLCGDNDAAYIRQLESLCTALVREGGYPLDPIHAARILRLVLEGSWVDMLIAEPRISASDARQTVLAALALCFGRHFRLDGQQVARIDPATAPRAGAAIAPGDAGPTGRRRAVRGAAVPLCEG